MKEILSCEKNAKSVVMRVKCKYFGQEAVFREHYVIKDE